MVLSFFLLITDTFTDYLTTHSSEMSAAASTGKVSKEKLIVVIPYFFFRVRDCEFCVRDGSCPRHMVWGRRLAILPPGPTIRSHGIKVCKPQRYLEKREGSSTISRKTVW